MISNQPQLSHFYQEELAKVEATQVVQAETGHFMIYFYLKSSSKFLLDEWKFYHAFWQKP